MAAVVLTNVTVLLGAYDITNFSGVFDMLEEVDMKEADHFGAQGYRVMVPGLHTATGSLGGNADFATNAVGQSFRVAQTGTQQAMTIIPTGTAQAVGDPAQFMRGRLAKLAMQQGVVGDLSKFTVELSGDYADIDGYLLAPLASRGAVTGAQVSGVPAVTATQQVFGVVHVTGAVGTNLTWTIQSAATGDAGFASPTTRITFATVSAVGWQYLTVAGPITDTRWRAVATIGTSTFTSAVAFGVL